MIGVAVVLVTFSVLLLSAMWIKRRKCDKSLPPGPGSFPLFGNLLQMAVGGLCHLTLSRWALKYGKIYTLHLPGKTVFVLNDANLMRDVLGKTAATGRPPLEIIHMIFWSGEYGVLAASGKEWLEQKQFFAKTLGKFGFGREGRVKELVLAEADKLCEWIDSENERGGETRIFLNDAVTQCTGNVMWSMITGQVLDRKDTNKLVGLIAEFMSFLPNLHKRGVMSFFKNIAPVYSGYEKVAELCLEIHKYIECRFKENEKTIICGEPPRDVIDAYIEKHKQCEDAGSTFYGECGKKHCYSATLNIMIAGTDPTGAMITWILFYLSVHGQVQRQLQEEIDNAIGRDREPALEDKENMPYMEAVTLESLRFSSMVPSGGLVTLLEDVKLDEYLLPKGAHVLSNLHFAHNDRIVWGDPENFRPARFLEEQGKHLKDFVVSFRPGKRACPGARFARDIIFLFAAKLFQTFHFGLDPNISSTAEYLKPTYGVQLKPKKLALVVTRRE